MWGGGGLNAEKRRKMKAVSLKFLIDGRAEGKNMDYFSGPQPFWHQGPVSWKTIFPRGRGRDGSGGNAGNGEWQMKLVTCPLLTSCCVAWFLRGCRQGWGPLD